VHRLAPVAEDVAARVVTAQELALQTSPRPVGKIVEVLLVHQAA
jgi:hypothetical protein